MDRKYSTASILSILKCNLIENIIFIFIRCKASKQLEDPALTAAAAAAVAEAEAEERALAAALEAIARLPPRPGRGPRRSLCVEVYYIYNIA